MISAISPVLGAQQQPRGSAEAPEVVATICQDRVVGDDLRATCDGLREQFDERVVQSQDVSCCVSGHFNQNASWH
jgi:hypothetical protein